MMQHFLMEQVESSGVVDSSLLEDLKHESFEDDAWRCAFFKQGVSNHWGF